MDKLSVLKQYFGHDQFRHGQEALIDAITCGQDALGIMPTGSGKSMCYQIPALLLSGVTLVVSPLISLMRDQVSALEQAGVSVAFINSSLTNAQYDKVFQNAIAGEYKIIYVAPERLATMDFLRLCERIEISLLAVDEAHCISQWGQDFRPSYLKIAEFVAQLSYRPIIGAFTATATTEVRDDIIRILALQNPALCTTGFDRANLTFEVAKPKSKPKYLHSLLQQRTGKSGIVYCSTRKAVEQVCTDLCKCGHLATKYHAGLGAAERRENQEAFATDVSPIMVATNAFGMGIDKSNVSFVIHYNMPKNIESYYQEAGRAGRDGASADCILLFSLGDVETAKFMINNSSDNDALSDEEREPIASRERLRLDNMVTYCKTSSCLRAYILNYFGEHHSGNCNNCSNCLAGYVERDITLAAQKILSSVARIARTYRKGIGLALHIKVLHGSREARIFELGLDSLSTYGLMQDISVDLIRQYFDALIAAGYLRIEPCQFPVVHIMPKADAVLFGTERAFMHVRQNKAAYESADFAGKKSKARYASQAGTPHESPAMAALKAMRTKLATKMGVPAYIIFANSSLEDMASKMPKNIDEFLEVSGVGEAKAHRYGKEFLGVIAECAKN